MKLVITHFSEVQEISNKTPELILIHHQSWIQVQMIGRNNLQKSHNQKKKKTLSNKKSQKKNKYKNKKKKKKKIIIKKKMSKEKQK